jgi:hypothetical protein
MRGAIWDTRVPVVELPSGARDAKLRRNPSSLGNMDLHGRADAGFKVRCRERFEHGDNWVRLFGSKKGDSRVQSFDRGCRPNGGRRKASRRDKSAAQTFPPPGSANRQALTAKRTGPWIDGVLRAIHEPVALIVTLHLFTEQWLNLILGKFCPHFDLTRYTYRRKLEIAFAIAKLNQDLFWNLGKLNSLRNKIAHDLAFDLTTMDLDYRGCAEHFELSGFKPTLDPKAEGNHILNVLGLVAEVTFMKLHNYCMRELAFATADDKATFWSKTLPVDSEQK